MQEDLTFLKLAVAQAQKSVTQGGFPAGAVVVKDGEVVSEGVSIGFKQHDPSSHAETAAIRAACAKLHTADLTGATLYESIQSCTMCFSVAYWAGISRIVFAVRKTPEMVKKYYYEGMTDLTKINQENNRQIELVFLADLEKDSLGIVANWEQAGGFNQ